MYISAWFAHAYCWRNLREKKSERETLVFFCCFYFDQRDETFLTAVESWAENIFCFQPSSSQGNTWCLLLPCFTYFVFACLNEHLVLSTKVACEGWKCSLESLPQAFSVLVISFLAISFGQYVILQCRSKCVNLISCHTTANSLQ